MSEWISVEDGVPEDAGFEMSDDVLCVYEYFRYGDYNCMYQGYGIGRYDYHYCQWSGDVAYGDKCRVLYWMPIPEPPEVEQ